jgi:hypothetical protein
VQNAGGRGGSAEKPHSNDYQDIELWTVQQRIGTDNPTRKDNTLLMKN